MISWSNWRLSCNTVGSVTTEGRHVVSSSSSLSLSLWVPGGNNELLRPNCPPSCTAARTKSKEPLHTGSLFGRALELGRQLASGNHEQLYIVHTKRWMRKQTWLGQRWNREHIKWSIPNQCDNCFNFFHMWTWKGGRQMSANITYSDAGGLCCKNLPTRQKFKFRCCVSQARTSSLIVRKYVANFKNYFPGEVVICRPFIIQKWN